MNPQGPARTAPQRLEVVEVADLKVSDDPGVVLVTYALGSCIAVCAHDRVVGAAGMVHYMLPRAKCSPEKAASKPAMFGDTGIPLLFERLFALGCRKENIEVKLAGGGNLHDQNGTFRIGQRNYTVAKKLLWKNGILIAAEDVGGPKSRTVRLFVGDGSVLVKSHGEEVAL